MRVERGSDPKVAISVMKGESTMARKPKDSELFESQAEESALAETADMEPGAQFQVETVDIMAMDPSEFKLPWLRLNQALSGSVQTQESRAGLWQVDGYDSHESVHIVVGPGTYGRYRTKRGADNLTVVCRSADTFIGIGDPGGDCRTCSFKDWTPGKPGEKNKPPECSFGHSFLVYVIEDEAVARVTFERTGEPIGDKILSNLRTYMTNPAIGNPVFKLGSTTRPYGQGNYFAPQATWLRNHEVPKDCFDLIDAMNTTQGSTSPE